VRRSPTGPFIQALAVVTKNAEAMPATAVRSSILP
jgi:hypothetical protein